MANEEDVKRALALLHDHRPIHAFEEIHKREMGLVAVLRYLDECQAQGAAQVTSKEISDAMQVSSARMTVVLKKLEQKGLIVKAGSATDARSVVISLSAQGQAHAKQLNERMYRTVEKMVDEFGMEELQKLMESLGKLQRILHENKPNQLEEDYA